MTKSPPTERSQSEAALTDASSRHGLDAGVVKGSAQAGAHGNHSTRYGPAAITALAVIVAAVIGAVGLWIVRPQPPPPPACVLPPGTGVRACIETPQANDVVSGSFVVDGRLAGVPDGSHIWVATKIGDLVWPKEPEVPIGPAFDVTVVEAGQRTDEGFSIVLLLVDAQRHRAIEEWLSKPDKPGLSLGEGIQMLASVANLRLR